MFFQFSVSLLYQKVSEYAQENHNHILHTNPGHREEEQENIYSNNTYLRQ